MAVEDEVYPGKDHQGDNFAAVEEENNDRPFHELAVGSSDQVRGWLMNEVVAAEEAAVIALEVENNGLCGY